MKFCKSNPSQTRNCQIKHSIPNSIEILIQPFFFSLFDEFLEPFSVARQQRVGKRRQCKRGLANDNETHRTNDVVECNEIDVELPTELCNVAASSVATVDLVVFTRIVNNNNNNINNVFVATNIHCLNRVDIARRRRVSFESRRGRSERTTRRFANVD